MLFEKVLPDDFVQKIKDVSLRLGINPDHLASVIGFETGYTFSPSVRNPKSSATGLIQFMAATAQALGTSTAALASMSAVAQMDYVERYFRGIISQYGPLNNLVDVYLAVFYPAAITKPIYYKFSTAVAKVNPVFDENGDRDITKAEVMAVITARTAKNCIGKGLPSLFTAAPVLAFLFCLSVMGYYSFQFLS